MLCFRPLLLTGLLLAGDAPAWAQVGGAALPGSPWPDSLQAAYPFLNPAAGRLENATLGLQRFYQRLLKLQAGELPGRTVSVVLLGDSHTQADELAGELRQQLQAAYGNAGRGLVFPYQAARTNGSPSVRFAALAGTWRSRRLISVKPDTTLPLGVAGFSVATADTTALLRLRIPAAYRASADGRAHV